jgi:hypothetical protein
MMRSLAYLIVICGIVLAAGTAARAAECAPYNQIVARLAAVYGETSRAVTQDARKGRIEVFIAPLGGSWTLAATDASGQTCLIAAGQGFGWQAHLPHGWIRDG